MSNAERAVGRRKAGAQGGTPDSGEFASHFETYIKPHFDALEGQRLALKERFTCRLAAALAGTGLLFLALLVLGLLVDPPADASLEYISILIIVTLLGGLLFYRWALGPRRQFARRYKQQSLPAIADFFGEFSYDSEGGIPMERVYDSGLIAMHGDYRHEDLFTGRYRGVEVAFCEAKLLRPGVIFDGLFVLFRINKKFNGMTVLGPDGGRLGNWFRNSSASKFNMNPVKLEDPQFEEKFEVYSTDQVEARYLLTPAFMRRLMDLSRIMGTDNVQAAFFNEQLFIKLSQPRSSKQRSRGLRPADLQFDLDTSLFEAGSLYKSVYDSGGVYRIVEEFKSILSIVDILKLHERTGL